MEIVIECTQDHQVVDGRIIGELKWKSLFIHFKRGELKFKNLEKISDKHKLWMDEVSKICGGLDMFALGTIPHNPLKL